MLSLRPGKWIEMLIYLMCMRKYLVQTLTKYRFFMSTQNYINSRATEHYGWIILDHVLDYTLLVVWAHHRVSEFVGSAIDTVQWPGDLVSSSQRSSLTTPFHVAEDFLLVAQQPIR